MSDKELVLDLPKNTNLSEISKEIEFLAALREGERQADCGEVVPHEQVKKEFKSWLSK